MRVLSPIHIAKFSLSLFFGWLCLSGLALATEFGNLGLKYPAPSPDGANVVVQGNFDGRWQLYLINAETEQISRLHISSGNDTHPAWSNDGKEIVFASDRADDSHLFVLTVATGEIRQLTNSAVWDAHPKWSEDDQWIYFNRYPNPDEENADSFIARVRPDGGDYSVIASSKNIETFVAPSPDGKSIAFVEWFPFTSDDGSEDLQGDLVIVDVKSGTRQRLTNSREFNGYPVWANDGKIYFTLFKDGSGQLHHIDPDSGDLKRVHIGGDKSVVRAYPSGDTKFIYYNIGHGEEVALFREELK